jgi:hypothetical protein
MAGNRRPHPRRESSHSKDGRRWNLRRPSSVE